MRLLAHGLVSALCLAFACGGIAILAIGDSSQMLDREEAVLVSGGTINPLNYTYTNCPPNAGVCTMQLCNQNPPQVCPYSAEYYQTAPQYPSGTQAGTAWESVKPQNYTCRVWRVCGTGCNQSPVNNQWYCTGVVGPAYPDAPVAGIIGDVPASTEA